MSMGWGYPPGVTGREYEIAGPDRECEEQRACSNTDECGFRGLVTIEVLGNTEFWDCPKCGAQHSEYTGPDPDDYEEGEDDGCC